MGGEKTLFPSPALSGSGSLGVISALTAPPIATLFSLQM